MNPKLSLFLGFIIGVAAGVGGMRFTLTSPQRPPTQPPQTNDIARQVAEAAREKNLRGPNWWDMDAPTPEVRPAPSGTVATAAPVTKIAGDDSQPTTNRDDWFSQSPEERQRRFASYWSNQMNIARANFISNAVLSQDEAIRFDVLTDAMNLRLQQRLDPVIEQYQNGWRPTPEDRTRLALEVSTILANTYDDMDRNMPEGWREGVTNSYFSLTQFVPPQYMPFMRGISGGVWQGGGGPGVITSQSATGAPQPVATPAP